MPLRLVEITANADARERLQEAADQTSALNYTVISCEDGVMKASALVQPETRQDFLDRIQGVLGEDGDWRIVVMGVEAVIPYPEESEELLATRRQQTREQSREELYDDVASGAVLDLNFMLMVGLSTVVAVVGLAANNVAVLIGAMVIAPLLGPNLAMILATALGDGDLAKRSVKASAAGLGITIGLGIAVGQLLPINLQSHELLLRTHVGPADIALALASGAAAALSLTTGVSSTLVGVMVAVALLPPAATVGVMIGAEEFGKAFDAFLLLSINMASVNLAGQVVFLAKRVGPRTWSEKRAAKQSTMLRITLWAASLAILGVVVWLNPF